MKRLDSQSQAPSLTAPAGDHHLRERADVLLCGHPYLALRRISCECRDGRLISRGCVPSFYLKQIAQATVAKVDGVSEVENQLEVVATT